MSENIFVFALSAVLPFSVPPPNQCQSDVYCRASVQDITQAQKHLWRRTITEDCRDCYDCSGRPLKRHQVLLCQVLGPSLHCQNPTQSRWRARAPAISSKGFDQQGFTWRPAYAQSPQLVPSQMLQGFASFGQGWAREGQGLTPSWQPLSDPPQAQREP